MVAPISGPFTRTETVKGPPNFYGFRPDHLTYSRTWYRQRRPYTLPLTFTYLRRQVLGSTNLGNVGYDDISSCLGPFTLNSGTWFPDTYNRAYAKFKNLVTPDNAGMAINLHQRQQAMDMIANRSLQILRSARALSKLRFGDAAKALGLSRPPMSWKQRGKSFGDMFLEAHFGWEPLVKDIGSSIEILQKGVPPMYIVAAAKGSRDNTAVNTTSDPETFDYTSYLTYWKIAAHVSVSNPNLYLANELGFVNPALVAWDAIPFSFVLGWFLNVDSFLSSFSDFWGLNIINPSVTCHVIAGRSLRWTQKAYGTPPKRTQTKGASFQTVQTQRTIGSIPGPTLRFSNPWVISPVRALTSVSLLLQQLSKFK